MCESTGTRIKFDRDMVEATPAIVESTQMSSDLRYHWNPEKCGSRFGRRGFPAVVKTGMTYTFYTAIRIFLSLTGILHPRYARPKLPSSFTRVAFCVL
jgi:hypothetical protein